MSGSKGERGERARVRESVAVQCEGAERISGNEVKQTEIEKLREGSKVREGEVR